jgi:hypothetical protein
MRIDRGDLNCTSRPIKTHKPPNHTLWLGFSVLNFLSILSDSPLTGETERKKSQGILQNFIF